jgi:hypothetical protein
MRLTLGGVGTRTIVSNSQALPTVIGQTTTTPAKSRSGYLFTLGRGPINYKSKQQTYVAQSTCEAEYYSAGDATKEGLHLRQLTGEIFNAPIT